MDQDACHHIKELGCLKLGYCWSEKRKGNHDHDEEVLKGL